MMIHGAAARPENFRMFWRETVRQMVDIGVGSFLIVAVISVFIGAVTAVQFAYQIVDNPLVPGYYIGWVVRDSTILELAPTLSCLILAGKAGSNIASELGTMRLSEQIDAQEIMGVNTLGFLVGPRILGALIVIPMLVTIGAGLGILGGYFATIASGFVTGEEFVKGALTGFKEFSIQLMLTKAFVFAFVLTSVACYQGYYVSRGSVELGQASTRAVVYGSILILLFDYVIALLLLF